ncbi:hypothetical protein DelCs14_2265 [Delftia sp. Cs1-4]|nr:hypothetical protein DelCs14_2265 [Delftia sp. Cs1-4]
MLYSTLYPINGLSLYKIVNYTITAIASNSRCYGIIASEIFNRFAPFR